MQKTAILTGMTAAGKTSLAIEFAREHSGIEIINADSLLIYRHMDIGTAKPTHDERHNVNHHLIDIREPNEQFTAGDFVREVHQVIDDLEAKGKRAIVVGGTGFYLKALTHGLWETGPSDPVVRAQLDQEETPALFSELRQLSPDSAEKIGESDRYRLIRALEVIQITGKAPHEHNRDTQNEEDPEFELMIIDRPNGELHERIGERTRQMLEDGLVGEVEKLMADYPDARVLNAVGYRQTVDHLKGVQPEGRPIREGQDGLSDEINLATRQLVKRQRTWFRGQHVGHWFILDEDRERLIKALEEIYA